MNCDIDKIESIFISALEITSERERQAFIDTVCGSDQELRQRVEKLVENHFLAGSFLQTSDRTSSTSGVEQPGMQIGPYKLLEQIGEGGFGVVFRAKQLQPIRRTVAVKVIKPGMDTSQVISRFENERQALALMDHPNIARVLDGGETEHGRPYFVMELVDGVPITDFCDANRMTTRQRLELFILVCEAVQHAHQKGIIHRDIKPSNVLIAQVDGRLIPKVIDFGVAKAMKLDLLDVALETNIGALIGTPQYMSPEQADSKNADVDTRTDVYLLGVLLYELLTGLPPFDIKEFANAGILEMLRVIREVDPPTPSSRLSGIDGLPTIAVNRSVEPRRLTSLLRHDLDWIVMKCLEKNKSRRYATANALSSDVERYLNEEPVEAAPPSFRYRLQKFLRRNQGAVIAASLLLLTLIGGIVGTSMGLLRAEQGRVATGLALTVAKQQRDRAERHYQRAMSAVDRLLTRVGGGSLVAAPRMDETRRQILEDALEFYREILTDESDDPAARREVGLAWQRVGEIQNQLSRHQESEESLNQAIDIQRDLVTEFPDDPKFENDLLRSHRQLAIVLYRMGRMPEAEQMVEDMLSRVPNATPDGRYEQFYLHFLRGILLASTQRMEGAISSCEESLELADQLVRDEPSNSLYQFERANVLSVLGELYRLVQRLDDAEKSLLEGRASLERMLVDDPGDINAESGVASLCINLGLTYANLNRYAEAKTVYQQAIATFYSLARDHPGLPNYKMDLAKAHSNFALLHSINHDPVQAVTENEKALMIFEELRQTHPQRIEFAAGYAGGCGNQAKYLIEQDRWEESLVWNSNAINAADELLVIEPRHSETRRLLHNSLMGRAGAYRRLNQLELAIHDYRRSLELSEGESHAIDVNFRPRALAFVGEHAKAASEAEAIVTRNNATSSNFNEMAKVYGTCIEAVGRDPNLSDDERAALAELYAARSVELLSMAAEKGHFPTSESVIDLRNDDRLHPIQDRNDFKELLSELEAVQSPY